MPNPDISSQYDTHTSWQHIWRLSWPIMLSNITVPLVGVVDVAMMGRFDDQPGRSNCLYRRLLDLGSDAANRTIFGFSNGWIFVGATRGKEMRNAMLVASASFTATILLVPFDLMALVGSFVGYLALRGMSLWYLISHVYKVVNP